MRKNLWFWLALLVIMALVAACGGAAVQQAEAPAANAPAATEEPAAEATEAAEEPAAEATEAAAEEPAAEGEAPAEGGFLTRDYEGTKLKVFFGPVQNEEKDWPALVKDFTEQTGIEVEQVVAPQSATDMLAQMLQFLGAGSADIDLYQIDVIWPGIVADHAVDLKEYIPQEEIDAHFPAIVENNTVDGKLVGMPWFTDAGLLYYRTDLLEKYGYAAPPKTWDELTEMATKIQEGERGEGNESFWGFVWQGSNYEGLTCDALEWQISEGGGQIIEPDGTITVNNPAAAAAFERAKGWVDTISPPGVTTYLEEDARGVWQSGNAAFMRNWPYAYSLGNSDDSPIKGKFDATVLPQGAGGRSGATLGGWQMMVSKYSANIEAAAMLARYLTSPEGQKFRAIGVSSQPTIASLYTDPGLLEAQPFMGRLLDVFNNAVARPSTVTGELYNEVSTAYFDGVHSILTGEAPAEDALQDLEDNLVDITGFEVGQPK